MPSQTIAGVRAESGTKAFGFLPIAPMLHGSDLKVGVHVVAGAQPGPTFTVFACQHGDELVPLPGLRKLLHQVDPRQLKGTLVVVPIANPAAFAMGLRDSWIDGLTADSGNINRLWPGSSEGWLTERMAAVLTREILEKSDYVVDLHAAGVHSIYYCYMRNEDDEFSQKQRELALAFGMEIILTKSIPYKGTLTGYCNSRGIMAFGAELGDFYGLGAERGQYPESELRRDPLEVCVTGLSNQLKHLGMLEGEIWRPRRQVAVSPEVPIRASKGGLLFPEVTRRDIGTVLPRGAALARVIDPYSFEEIEVVRADCFDQQLLIAASDHMPMIVNPGDKVFWVADYSTVRWYERGK